MKKHRIGSVNRQGVVTNIYHESIEIVLLRLTKKQKKPKNKQLNMTKYTKINKEHLKYLYVK